MGVTWTEEQLQVITQRHKNILVSAAAGSGKTAVLVERIIRMISEGEHPIDIDRLLVVTFTKAAALEMRERISAAIEKRLAEDEENEHLQKQLTLIHHAQITTIHSFCQHVIRSYFHVIDLDPAFRIGDEGEMKLIRQDVMKNMLEEWYQEGTEEFLQFAEQYASGKTDVELEEQISSLYEFSMSHPWPEKWLDDCIRQYEVSSFEEMEKTDWMQEIIRQLKVAAEDALRLTETSIEIARESDGPWYYEEALLQDQAMFERMGTCQSYDEFASFFANSCNFAKLPAKRDKNVSDQKKEQIKQLRDQAKKMMADLEDDYFYDTKEQILYEMQQSAKGAKMLINLTKCFYQQFAKKKEEKNLLDFHDLEHFALKILVRQEGEESVPTEVADGFAEQFEEVLIDEYQDSNLVQEMLLTSVSRERFGNPNIFMVGDVKQSIYRFRLARPELFMEKYHTYPTEGEGEHLRIDLHKNFRSRPSVLSSVNQVFEQIMARQLGGVSYDKDAALYPGAVFPQIEEEKKCFFQTEILIADLKEEKSEEDTEERQETVRELEARAVGKRISEIVGKEKIVDKETGEYRLVEYRDIVLLLRTVSGWAESFAEVLDSMGIPSYTGTQTGYFSAWEVQTVLAMLQILDNPRQDIAMAAVLNSPIGCLSGVEMAKIKSAYPKEAFYEGSMRYAAEGEEEELREKLHRFFLLFEEIRSCISYMPIHKIIWMVLEKTGYREYAAAMPGGEQRKANLDMLLEKAVAFEAGSYRGLFHFVRYIESLQKYEIDFGEANTFSEQENAVRIMSIHKSKGLEFPIVFVCGLNKPFNQQDQRSHLLYHPDLGIGCDYVDLKLRIKRPTLIKKVMQTIAKKENLGEELRILYVAMTRAKEKLILTAAMENLEKRLEKWSNVLRCSQVTLPYYITAGASSFMDWVMDSIVRHPSGIEMMDKRGYAVYTEPIFEEPSPVQIQIWKTENFVEEEIKRQVEQIAARENLIHFDTEKTYDESVKKALEQIFQKSYPFPDQAEIHGKLTVSELKRRSMEMEEQDDFPLYKEPEIEDIIPDFIEKKELSGAAKGTLLHRFLQHFDYKSSSTMQQIKEQMERQIQQGYFTVQEAESVRLDKIWRFVRSTLGQRMVRAEERGELYREQPFVFGIKASELEEGWAEDETILVQGMIDAYFLEDGEYVIVDYKTDFVEKGKERDLYEKYKIQLSYYERALAQISGIKVKEKALYSFWLEKDLKEF